MKLMISVLGIILGLASAVHAHADWKGYPGLNCMPSSGANDVRRSLSGSANWQDDPTIIYCPVVRDIAAGGADRIKKVNVRLFNNNGSKGGWCRLISRTISGATHDWEEKTWPAGYQDHTISLGPLNTSNWGNIALYCSMPGKEGARKSFIKSYAVEEQ